MRSTFAARKWSRKAERGKGGGGTLREHVCCSITDGQPATAGTPLTAGHTLLSATWRCRIDWEVPRSIARLKLHS